MTEKLSLQNIFLQMLCDKHMPVSIFLKSGIQLKGQITNFDRHVVLFEGNGMMQMVYRHAISTILPSQKMDITLTELATTEIE